MTARKLKPTTADRTVKLHFPNEQACVRILEILRPFTPAQRDLILNVVAANPSYPSCEVRGVGGFAGVRTVVMPEPLLAVVERRAQSGKRK